ncbi:MAG: (2Fe-2S)-binding protein [Nitriliruptoraceae bacterium]
MVNLGELVHDPLAAARVLGFDCARTRRPGEGWLRLDRYLADPAIVDLALRQAGRRFGQPEVSQKTAAWLTAELAAAIGWPTAAMVLTDGRRPVRSDRDVHLPHPAAGVRRATRFAPTGEDEPASPAQVADGLVAALDPVVEVVHARTRRGRHALWATVTDMVAAAFHRIGDAIGRSDEARDLATRIIASNDALRGGTNWCEVPWSGGVERTRVRNICCLWYQTEGGATCITCPRLGPEDRQALVERRRRPSA